MTSVVARDPCKVYLERFVFMAALLIPAFFLGGARPVAVSVFCLIICVIADFICCKIRRIEYDYKDYSVLFWGLSVSLVMPAGIPYIHVALAAVICVVIGKHMFGGKENVVFSPAAIAASFLIICYPAEMLYFPKVGEKVPVFADYSGMLVRDIDNAMKLGNVPPQSILDILMGNVPGAIGSVSILVIAVCGICMMIRRNTSICALVSCFLTVCMLAFFFPRIEVSPARSIFYELSSGYLLFGMVFMAAEPYIIPQRRGARVIYGVVLGYTTMMFRYFGQTEGCFMFALLITNALSCGFDTIIDNLSYWKKAYIGSYEDSKNAAQRGNIKLTDTQEIQLPAKYRYNTPPIDSKVKKHRKVRRRKGDRSE